MNPAATFAPQHQRPGSLVQARDDRLDGVAQAYAQLAVGIRQLLHRHGTLGLGADIYEHAVAPDGHDAALYPVAHSRLVLRRAGMGLLELTEKRLEIFFVCHDNGSLQDPVTGVNQEPRAQPDVSSANFW